MRRATVRLQYVYDSSVALCRYFEQLTQLEARRNMRSIAQLSISRTSLQSTKHM